MYFEAHPTYILGLHGLKKSSLCFRNLLRFSSSWWGGELICTHLLCTFYVPGLVLDAGVESKQKQPLPPRGGHSPVW